MRDGSIPFPLVGHIKLDGLTITQVAQVRKDLLEKKGPRQPNVIEGVGAKPLAGEETRIA